VIFVDQLVKHEKISIVWCTQSKATTIYHVTSNE